MNHNSLELRIGLQRGSDISAEAREEFIRTVRTTVPNLLAEHGIDRFHNGYTSLCKLLRETVSNIFDHTISGKGEAIFVFHPDTSIIDFEIKDSDIVFFDPETINKNLGKSSKYGNKINFGMGIRTIMILSQSSEFISFNLDTSCGFKYTGSIQLKSSKEI